MKKILKITAVGAVTLVAAVCAVAMTMHQIPERRPGIEGKDPSPITLPADAKLVEISFRYNIAMNMEGSYTYTIKDLGGKAGYELKIECPMYKEDEVFTTKIKEEEWLAAKALVDSLNLNKWNGYHKYDTMCRDGSSFSSCFVYKTGEDKKISVSASGTNVAPDGKGNLQSGLESLFKPYQKKYNYDRIPKKIKSNNLETLFVTFKQQGKSGYSHYEFEFRKSVWEGGYNVNAHWFDHTGEFGPKMERDSDMEYILAKDVKNLDLSPINAVLKKYKIASINGYSTSAEDYNNQEWFQIGAYYTSPIKDSDKVENESLNIMGTEKFANYNAFRRDFLKACIAVAKKYK